MANTTPNLFLDLLAYGIAANRPTTPHAPPGGVVFYYATDTAVLSVWNDGAATPAWVDQLQLGKGIALSSLTDAITASTTHTLLGAVALTSSVNRISICAGAADAVALPAAVVGAELTIYNDGAAAAAVWPQAADKIDGGAAGVAVTLTNAKRATFTCYKANNWISAQLGVASA